MVNTIHAIKLSNCLIILLESRMVFSGVSTKALYVVPFKRCYDLGHRFGTFTLKAW